MEGIRIGMALSVGDELGFKPSWMTLYYLVLFFAGNKSRDKRSESWWWGVFTATAYAYI